ncbi:hypothetical protein A2U01_0069781, partial [Trifolium medium]|nr:hypothetical protein [Trifolium medium]
MSAPVTVVSESNESIPRVEVTPEECTITESSSTSTIQVISV